MSNSDAPVARFLITAAAFVIVVAGMQAAASLLVPFMTSVFIAVICMPPIRYLRDLGLPHGASVALIVVLVVIVITLLGAIFGGAANQFAADIPEYQQRLAEIWSGLVAWLVDRGVEVEAEAISSMVQPERVFPFAGNLLASFGSLMTNALVILLTVVFILTEEVSLYQKLGQAFPDSHKASDTLSRVMQVVNQYVAIKAAISLLTAILVWLLLVAIGVDYPVLWATLAFMLNFIPTFGSLIAAVPTVLLALVQLGPLSALYTAVGYLVINTLVGNVIEPRVMGKGLGLSPFVVLISLIFWGWVLGSVGMLLSVPLTMMVKISLELFPETNWVGTLMGDGRDQSMGDGRLDAADSDDPNQLEATID